jgi:hypothetical protein
MTVSWRRRLRSFRGARSKGDSMMRVVLIGGIGLLVAGLVTVGLGIELELSFGNTLLLAGVIVACTGVLLLGLWIAVRELRAIAGQFSALPASSQAASPRLSAGLNAMLGDQAPEDGGFPFSRDQPEPEHAGYPEPAVPLPAPPWLEEAASRGRGEASGPAPVEASAVTRPRRNLLFSSSRKERERAQARAAEPSVADPPPGALEPAEPDAVPPATFDDAWPRSERARAGDAPLPRRSGRTPSTFADAAGAAGADRVASTARSEGEPQVTVLKSGVVDGMAYSLYSDGSIEAEMPEGMMRFASIDELRAHLDQRP